MRGGTRGGTDRQSSQFDLFMRFFARFHSYPNGQPIQTDEGSTATDTVGAPD